MKRSRIEKALASALSILLFATNCVFASAPEANFWRKRHKNIELASLPQPYAVPNSIHSLPPIPKSIPAQISNKRINKWIQRKGAHKLKEILKTFPAQYGSIRAVAFPKNKPTDKIVIHIQDIHQNPEAQKNIGLLVQELINQEKIDLVALEGAFEPIELNDFREFPNKKTIQQVADYLLKENKISGPIHTAFTSPTEIPPFVGIDDPLHYKANVEAIRQATPQKEKIIQLGKDLKKDLEGEKKRTFNPGLLRFDHPIQAYRRGGK